MLVPGTVTALPFDVVWPIRQLYLPNVVFKPKIPQ